MATSTSSPGSGRARPAKKIALVHDWLTGMRGGEKVLDAICELYPDATLHTLVRVRGAVAPRIEGRGVRTTFLQAIPAARLIYRHLLPLFPTAVETFDLDDYDLVISSSHAAVKSVIPPGRAVHICYCHSPMRYAWDQFPAYFGPDQVGEFRSLLLRPVMAGLARWDAATAGRVDRFLANSQYVAGRIQRYYNRRSTVVYPPVDTTFYTPAPTQDEPGDAGFLVVSALVPYKRVDVAIEACRRAHTRLTVVGRGPELEKLQRLGGPDVRFTGWLGDEDIRELYRRSSAVLLPGVEDFGMVPVEAQACGTPAVALARGGTAETIQDGVTGVLVDDPSAEAFAAGLARVASMPRDRQTIRANAERFSRERFMTAFTSAVDDAIAEREAMTW